jgi:hypothetical protein
VREAIRILVKMAPLGRITLFIMLIYFCPSGEFARSTTSDRNDNIDLQASLY